MLRRLRRRRHGDDQRSDRGGEQRAHQLRRAHRDAGEHRHGDAAPDGDSHARAACGFTFADNSANHCGFNGPFNQDCGNALDSTFSNNGTTLIVTIDTMLSSPPIVQFSARVDSPTSASLMTWTTNNFQTQHPTAGSVQLNNNGTQLVTFPNDPPFMILSCNFVQYLGDFTGSRCSARDSSAGVDPVVYDRIRAGAEQSPPELASP